MTGFPAALAYSALALFWVHTLLIAAAGWSEARALLGAWAREARRARVLQGTGPEGQLAVHRVRQVGRSRGDGKIWFHDRAYEAALLGGEVAIGDERRALAAGGSVWPAREKQVAAGGCPGTEAFSTASARAIKASGWERAVEVALGPGDAVWLSEGPDGPLVAAEDPTRWRRRVTALTLALVVGLVLGAAGLTALCLWPPVFGTVSKIGAFAALVVFNLFQLFGKLHHEAIQPPGVRGLGGLWRAP